jgi:hypothetical protein
MFARELAKRRFAFVTADADLDYVASLLCRDFEAARMQFVAPALEDVRRLAAQDQRCRDSASARSAASDG